MADYGAVGCLARRLEENDVVRRRLLEKPEQILTRWINPKAVGIASVKAMGKNQHALELLAEWWVHNQPVPKTVPIDRMREEAGLGFVLYTNSCFLGCRCAVVSLGGEHSPATLGARRGLAERALGCCRLKGALFARRPSFCIPGPEPRDLFDEFRLEFASDCLVASRCQVKGSLLGQVLCHLGGRVDSARRWHGAWTAPAARAWGCRRR